MVNDRVPYPVREPPQAARSVVRESVNEGDQREEALSSPHQGPRRGKRMASLYKENLTKLALRRPLRESAGAFPAARGHALPHPVEYRGGQHLRSSDFLTGRLLWERAALSKDCNSGVQSWHSLWSHAKRLGNRLPHQEVTSRLGR